MNYIRLTYYLLIEWRKWVSYLNWTEALSREGPTCSVLFTVSTQPLAQCLTCLQKMLNKYVLTDWANRWMNEWMNDSLSIPVQASILFENRPGSQGTRVLAFAPWPWESPQLPDFQPPETGRDGIVLEGLMSPSTSSAWSSGALGALHNILNL